MASDERKARPRNDRTNRTDWTNEADCVVAVMKIIYLITTLSFLVLAGCASSPETSDIRVRTGMSRDDLKLFFGNPVRIQATSDGCEDWYYRFRGWRSDSSSESGTAIGTGGTSSYGNASVQFSQDTEEAAVHVSADGHVVEPIPEGKIVRD